MVIAIGSKGDVVQLDHAETLQTLATWASCPGCPPLFPVGVEKLFTLSDIS